MPTLTNVSRVEEEYSINDDEPQQTEIISLTNQQQIQVESFYSFLPKEMIEGIF